MNSANIQTSLAGRYASALFELAHENDAKRGVERVEADLNTLAAALADSADLRAVTTNPQLSRKAQSEAIAAVAKHLKVGDLTAKFLGVLAANRRLGDVTDMIRAFTSIAAAHRGELTAEVVSAHALSKKNIDALSKKLSEREGQNVTIKTKVDPDLLGGLVITIGSRRIDGSIRTRLNSLAHAMKG